VPRGAAIFSLEGTFIGLVAGGGGSTITVIPGDFLKEVAASATAAAERRRGHLGVRVDALTESLGRATGATVGVIVNDVIQAGPAVGVLLPGDVIQSIGGAPVMTVGDFRRAEEAIAPNQPVSVSILRRRAAEQVSVRAADALAMTAPAPVDVPGFVLRPVDRSGIEVVAIDAGTPAARAGLQRGDLIVAIDGRPAEDVSGLMRAFSGAPVGGAWVLTVHRGLQRQTLALEKR
jgi:S1-C subfamily serine protease